MWWGLLVKIYSHGTDSEPGWFLTSLPSLIRKSPSETHVMTSTQGLPVLSYYSNSSFGYGSAPSHITLSRTKLAQIGVFPRKYENCGEICHKSYTIFYYIEPCAIWAVLTVVDVLPCSWHGLTRAVLFFHRYHPSQQIESLSGPTSRL